MRRLALVSALSLLVLLLLGGLEPAADPDRDPAQDVATTVDGTIDIRQQTQQDADAWAAERTELLQRYRNAQADFSYLTERKRLVADRLRGLEERVAELDRRLGESQRLQTGLEDTLAVMLGRLEEWIARDLPFLPDERGMRMGHLRAEMIRPEVPPSEKLRRLLEALQIEAQYGAAAEVYQDRIALGDDSLFVDVLRLGRLSLFWRTPDGARVGEYDRATGQWVELPSKHRRALGRAMEMADRRRPIELIALPLGRIRP